MKKKVYLSRDSLGYDLYKIHPKFMPDEWDCEHWDTLNKSDIILSVLCVRKVKQWFGLKKHLKMNTCISGTLNVSFTPDKPKKGKKDENN